MRALFIRTKLKLFAIVLIVTVVLSMITVLPVYADTTGPHYPATATGVSSPIFFIDWQNPNNISVDDNLNAYAYFYMTGNSDWLMASEFNFAIPGGAVINGIELTVSRFGIKAEGAVQNVRDWDVNLAKAGEKVGYSQAYQDIDWPATETSVIYGGADDLWGTTWTPAEINATDFGVAFKVNSWGIGNTAYIDFMRINITYTVQGTTLTTSAVSGTYGNTVTLSATLNSAPIGESIHFALNGVPACSSITDSNGVATCNAILKANAGTFPTGVSATFAGDPPYGMSTATASLTVIKRPIQVTAVTDARIYNGTVTSSGVPTLTAGSLAAGDTVTWSQSFINKHVGTGKTLIPSGAVNDGNGGENYAVTFINDTTGAISKLAITVTAVTSTKIYDGTTSSSDTPGVSPALGSGDSATWSQVFNSRNVGSGKTLTPSGTVNDGNGGNNYTVTFIPVTTGVINKRNITVTAEAKSKLYGGLDPTLTYTTNPALFGSDVLDGALTRAPGETVGEYPIGQGTLSGGTNYMITLFTGANFTITFASQTINITTHAPVRAYNGDTFTVAASSSSGLVVTYSASGGCTNVGATFTMTSSTSDCIVHYNQAGDTNFSPAPEVTEIVSAADAPVITLQPVFAKVLPGQNATFTAAATGTPAPTVQWQVSTDGGLTFNNLPGEISATLTIITPVQSSNGYLYRAVFTNTSGTATTNAAALHLLYYLLYLPTISN